MKPSIVWVSPPLRSRDIYGVDFEAGSKTPPLNLATLAAITRAQGYPTEIIDAEFLGWNAHETAEVILKKGFKYVAITAVTMSINKAAELAQILKQRSNEVVTLIGGVHLTAVPKETMERFPQFDIGVIMEGDLTVPELLERHNGGAGLAGVRGIIYRENGGLVITENRPFLKELDSLPMPAWDLLPHLSSYFRGPSYCLDKLPMGLLITSRGCPAQCNFCDRSVSGNHFRAYSAKYVLDMIREQYYKYGIRGMHIIDSNFILHKKRIAEICELLEKEHLDFSFSCLGRVSLVSPDILKMLKKAGCWRIDYGMESGSQKVLNVIEKGISLEQIRRAVVWAKEAGLKVRGFFMLGNPSDTKETIRETIDFAKSLDIDMFHFTFYTCFPGSTIYRDIGRYGALQEDWDKMTMWKPTFIPSGLTEEELIGWQKVGFREFYLRKKAIVNFLRMIKRPEHLVAILQLFIGFLRQMLRKVA